jgi:pimeloyl-ACP methyl ester carboxylesterase
MNKPAMNKPAMNRAAITSSITAAMVAVMLGSVLAQERQTMFNLGPYRLYLACDGPQASAPAGTSTGVSSRAPTVLLVTGFGRGSDALWAQVSPGIAKVANVCRYDRANIGKSERANGPMTTNRIVMDLEKLLEVSKLRGPLLLVGQGFGSFTVRAFAAKHPTRVAGAMLIEPQPEAFALKSLNVIPAKPDGEQNARELRPDFLIPRIADVNYAESAEQVAKAGKLGSMPLLVLVRGKTSSATDSATDNYPDGMNAALEKSQRELQTGLAKLSSQGKVQTVKTSGPILEDAPEAVVAAVRDLLALLRKSVQK